MFLHTDVTQVQLKSFLMDGNYVPILHFNIMGADYMAMQGARASATIILISSNRNNSVPAS